MKWIGLKEQTSIIYLYYHNSGTNKVWLPFDGNTELEATNPDITNTPTYLTTPFDGSVYSIQFASSVATSGNIATEFHVNASTSKTGSTLTTANWDGSNAGAVAAVYPNDWTFGKGNTLFISANPSAARNGVNVTIVLKYNTYGVSR